MDIGTAKTGPPLSDSTLNPLVKARELFALHISPATSGTDWYQTLSHEPNILVRAASNRCTTEKKTMPKAAAASILLGVVTLLIPNSVPLILIDISLLIPP